jgi:hypothetical protein
MALSRHTNVDPSSGAAGHLSEINRVSRYPIPKGPLLVPRLDRPVVRVVNGQPFIAPRDNLIVSSAVAP